jgi:hypothetical protein
LEGRRGRSVDGRVERGRRKHSMRECDRYQGWVWKYGMAEGVFGVMVMDMIPIERSVWFTRL